MTEEWRDLEKDLELCEQMPGDDWYAHATDDKCCACAQYVSTVPGLFRHDGRRGLEEGGNRQVDPSTVIAITLLQNPHLAVHDSGEWDKLTRFIAQSKKGWPYAIRRAMSAEARVKELEAEKASRLGQLIEKATELCDQCHGHLVQGDWTTVDGMRLCSLCADVYLEDKAWGEARRQWLQKIQQLERDNKHIELQNRQFQALRDRCDTEQKQRRKTERENRQLKDMLVRMVDMLAGVMEHGRLNCSERSVSPADCKGCERRAGCVTYDCVRVLERALRMGVIAEGYQKVVLEL